MAITQSGGSSQWSGTNASSYTLASYSAPAGTNRVLMVVVLLQRNVATDFTISSVTFGGNACTSAVEQTTTSTSRWNRAAIFYRVLGTSGSATVGDIVVTASTTMAGCIIYAVTLDGVDQASPVYYTNSATSIPSGIGVTSGARNGSYSFACATAAAGGTYTWSSNVGTEVFDLGPASADSTEMCGGGYYSITDPDAAVTFTISRGSAPSAQVAVAAKFQPALVGTTHSATAADTLGLAETRSRRAIYRPTATDGLSAAETRTRKGFLRPTAADILAAAETRSRRAVYRRTAADGLTAAETRTPRRTLRASAVEALGLAGGTGKRAAFQSAPVDLLRLLATAAGGGRIALSAADGVGVTEGAAGGWRFARTALDTWQLTRAVSRTATLRPLAADGLDLSELAEYPGAGESGELQLTPNADGKEDVTTGNIVLTNPQFNIRATTPYFAFKVNDLDVPAAAAVDAADMDWWVDTYDDPGLTIRAELNASPANLTTTAFDISSRTLTTAGAPWSAANVGTGQYVKTPDFAAVLEEVFALPGWTRGVSDLVIVVVDNGTGGRIQANTIDSASNKPRLNITWHAGGVTIVAVAADALALLEDSQRQMLLSVATQTAASLTEAMTATLMLVTVDGLSLSEIVTTLAGLRVGDSLVLGESAALLYALSLTEAVTLTELTGRLAALRAGVADALGVAERLGTVVELTAGDAVGFTEALAARRLLLGLAADRASYGRILTADIAGMLEAIASDGLGLSAVLQAGWTARVGTADALLAAETAATLRRLRATVTDAAAYDELAAVLKRATAGAADAVDVAGSLRLLLQTRAADGLELSEEAIGAVAAVLRALAADWLALDEGTALTMTVRARDVASYAAVVASLSHWLETAQDALGVADVTVYLLPNGIVRIEFGIMSAGVAFEIAMPDVGMALRQPGVVFEAHGVAAE